jgi:aspartate/glutamate racemase
MLSEDAELVVGVIGGLGPEATLDFFGKLLHHSKATRDQDHIQVQPLPTWRRHWNAQVPILS